MEQKQEIITNNLLTTCQGFIKKLCLKLLEKIYKEILHITFSKGLSKVSEKLSSKPPKIDFSSQ